MFSLKVKVSIMLIFSNTFLMFFSFLANTGAENIKELEIYSRPLPPLSVVSMSSCTLTTYTVRSKLDCAYRCSSLDYSTWLNYTKLGPDTASCVCLSTGIRTNSSTNTFRETTFFKTCTGDSCNISSGPSWLNKTCTSSSDCPAINSACYSDSHTCLCTPGYFYSITCNICYPGCYSSSLSNRFLKYSHACLQGYDDVHLYYVTSQQCGEACATDPRCLSFDYSPNINDCIYSYSTALTSNAFAPNCFGHIVDHYQRTCF